MGRSRSYIVLISCLLLAIAATAQSDGKTFFGLVAGDDGTLRMTFRTGATTLSTSADGTLSLTAEGMVSLAPAEGLPALPQASRLIELPRGTELRVEIWQASAAEAVALPGGRVLTPWQGAAVKDAEGKSVVPDRQAYATDSLMRWGAPLEVEDLGVAGDRQTYRVTVRPVAYNPVAGVVAVSGRISALLATSAARTALHAPSLCNRYLVVSRRQFREGLQPFVRWKRQEGFDVVEIYADTNQRDSVKALIEPWLADGATRHLLLVGDAAQLQAYIGTSRPSGLGTHPTDLYYAEQTGDYLPDALVGRWPVADTAELRAVVEKTLRYEQGLTLDTAAAGRVLLVAGRENTDPAPTTTNGQVNYLKDRMASAGLDTMCYYNPASAGQRDAILADIGSGTALLNYTAHCTNAGWSNPALTSSTVDTIETAMPTVYVNNCCLSNNFTGTCFGKQLLCQPGGGAVAVIGASNSTLWNEDYYWAVGPKYPLSLEPSYDSLRPGAFDRWLDSSAVSVGELLAAGNMAVSAFGSPYDRFYWEIYCLFGDPALVPWAGTPTQVALHVPDTLAAGTTELRVSGTPGALVTALQGDSLIGSVRLDNHRSSLLRLVRPLDSLPVVFTATKARWLPDVDTTAVVAPTGKAVTFAALTLCDTAADATLLNIGADTLYGLSATLLPPYDSTALCASFTAPRLALGTLPPQASMALHLPLHVDSWAPRLIADLDVADTAGDSWHLRLDMDMADSLPELAFALDEAGAEAVAAPAAGTECRVAVAACGIYDTLATAVTALPSGTTVEGHGDSMAIRLDTGTTHLRLYGHIGHGLYSRDYEYYLCAGNPADGFGNGLQAFPWQCGGTLPWTVDSTESHSGRYSLRSGAIDYRQTSVLAIDVLLPAADSIAFWLRTSTEPNYDKLLFSIDGVRALEMWGESGWQRYAYPLSAGSHRLAWRYSKDESTSEGSDCAWLDDVRLPLALWATPCGVGAADGNGAGIGAPSATPPQAASLFPNPSSGRVAVHCPAGVESVRVMDLYGRTVLTASPQASHFAMHLDPLPDGLYIVELHTAHGIVHTKLNLQHH